MRRPHKKNHPSRGSGSRGSSEGGRPPIIPKGRWAIGLHAVREALKVRPKAIAEMWLKEGWESSQDLRELADQAGQKIQTKPQGLLDKLAGGHQGVAARLTEEPPFDWSDLESAPQSLVLLADGLQDPHNLGAIIRTAWLLKVQAIFITENRSSPMTPTVMKVACGGAEHVPVIPDGNLLDAAKRLKDMGFWLYGMNGDAHQTLWQAQFPEKVALVVGSEESGIRTPLSRLCDDLIRIPQVATEASFNASVATAIGLSEVRRQHLQEPKKP
ncbi:MAG: 23S rRNA (guanosine(2251)-2'-O)-methyltransferase RlmB [Bdellovibrionales bacterium]